jgi:hypothetical protein
MEHSVLAAAAVVSGHASDGGVVLPAVGHAGGGRFVGAALAQVAKPRRARGQRARLEAQPRRQHSATAVSRARRPRPAHRHPRGQQPPPRRRQTQRPAPPFARTRRSKPKLKINKLSKNISYQTCLFISFFPRFLKYDFLFSVGNDKGPAVR